MRTIPCLRAHIPGLRYSARRPDLSLLPALLVSILLFPRPGLCDPPPDPDLEIQGSRKVGPFQVRPFLKLKDVGYDDNIFLDSETRVGDTTATLGPGFRALLLTGDRGGLHINQEFDYVAFGTYSDLNHWNSYSRLRGILLLKDFVVSLEDRYSRIRERPNTEIDRRAQQDWNTLKAEIRTLDTGRLALRLNLIKDRFEYSSVETAVAGNPERLNRDQESFGLAAQVRILPKTQLLLEGVLQDVQFEDRNDNRDTRSATFLPGLHFDATASIRGEVKLGVTSLEAPDRPDSDYRGLVGEAELTTGLGPRGRLKTTFLREVQYSVYADNLYFLHTRAGVGYERFFTRRWSAEIEYGRGSNRYPEPTVRPGDPGFEGNRKDRFTRYLLGFRYRVSDEVSMELQGLHTQRDSNDDIFDDERNLFTFGATYNF